MSRLVISLLGFWLVSLLLYACNSGSKPATQVTSIGNNVSKTSGEEARSTDWDKLMVLAKKEKHLIVYSTAGPMFRNAIIDSFGKKYDIDVEFVQGRGEYISQKLIAENKADIHMADVYVGGSTTSLTVLKPQGILSSMQDLVFLPEASDGKYWQTGKLNFVDKEFTTLNFSRYVNLPIIVNSELVRQDEIASFRDMLNPKWKGKIVLSDPTIPGGGLNWFYAVSKYLMNLDYMKELAKQEPLITTDQRQQIEWLAKGKVAISNPAKGEIETEFIKAGAPLKYVMPKEGAYLSASSGNLSLINKAPHPAAAKVFVNWLLTKEGQTAASKGLALPSARIDVPTDHLDLNMLIKPGEKYYESDSEQAILEKDDYAKKAKVIFGH